MYSNIRDIFKTEEKPGQIHCLNGLKVLSLAWILLGHTYYWSIRFSGVVIVFCRLFLNHPASFR